MTSKYAKLNKNVPQSEPLDSRQVENSAGGFVYQLDDWARLHRFLILGSDAPTYYASARKLTRENASCVERCFTEDADRAISMIVTISQAGQAPKNDSAIYALALGMAHPDVKVRQKVIPAINSVCRTATHLFMFVDMCRSLGRGWGRTLKRAVANWYESRSPASLGYQVIKYREREGYSHKRLLQTSHPAGAGEPTVVVGDQTISAQANLYRYVCEKDHILEALPAQVQAHIKAMGTVGDKELIDLIVRHNLPWEAIPTEAKALGAVWEAMLPNMGLTALVRNLSTMTRLDVLKPLSPAIAIVQKRLGDREELKKAKIHPFALLQALVVYKSGHGFRGKTTWTPVQPVVDALDKAFYLAFETIVPSNKRTLIGLDVSGSMGSSFSDSPLSVREAAAAMCMATVRSEPNYHIVGFTCSGSGHGRSSMYTYRQNVGLTQLPITASMDLDTVCGITDRQDFGGTDCALPMLYATERGLDVDTFVVYTDNETWAGSVHPPQALRDYRSKTKIPAKLVVVGMTSTGFSIADPNDAGMLDVVGFDSAAPAVIADFASN